jgi:hypothetical protein
MRGVEGSKEASLTLENFRRAGAIFLIAEETFTLAKPNA